jgi:hypothetical protein
MDIYTYRELLPRMVADLPGCPENIMLQALRLAGWEFLEQTEALLEEVVMATVAGQLSYTVTLATPDCRIQRVKYVKTRTNATSDWNLISSIDPSCFFLTGDNDDTITFIDNYEPSISFATGLQVTCVIVPKMEDSQGLPRAFLNRYYDGIIARALTILMLQPKKSWTNPDLAQYFDSIFTRKKGAAKREIYTKNKGGDIMIQQIAYGEGGF